VFSASNEHNQHLQATICLILSSTNQTPDNMSSSTKTSPPSLLMAGTTGYLGGTILRRLLSSPNPLISSLPISVLLWCPS